MSRQTTSDIPMKAPLSPFDALCGALGAALVCGLVFFLHQRDFDYIETEGLRAIVAKEMVERGGPSMPTVHERPYVNKPPLYAWTTCLLSQALSRFDEQVARLPSAVSATLLILVMGWFAGRWAGPATGMAAVAFGLSNVIMLDYGFRAELDMPFTFFVTVMFALLWPALTRTGPVSFVAWIGVYTAATLGAMWKAPHSLVFLWLGLLTYGYVKRTWRWLWAPGQILGLAGSMGVLVTWLFAVTRFAGGGRVGRAAGSEVVSRLAPGISDLVQIPLFPLLFALAALPGSLFLFAGIMDAVRQTGSTPSSSPPSGWRGLFLRVWRAIRLDPQTEFLLLMLIPGVLLLWLAPAKSGRYSLPMFPLLLLLAARFAVVQCSVASGGLATAASSPRVDRIRNLMFKAIGIAGLMCACAAILLIFKPGLSFGKLPKLGSAGVWCAAGIGGIAVSWLMVRGLQPDQARAYLGPALIVTSAVFQPLMMAVWWPARVKDDSQRDAAALIRTVVPESEPVFVLGRQEFPDTDLYSARRFIWIDSPADAIEYTSAPRPFFLMRENELIGDRKGDPDYRLAAGYKPRLTFTRVGRNVIVFQLDLHKAPQAPPSPTPQNR